MKQLSALGARRHFFRTNPRRMRALQPGELDDGQLQPGFNYFGGMNRKYIRRNHFFLELGSSRFLQYGGCIFIICICFIKY